MWVIFAALVVGTMPAVVRAMYPPLLFSRALRVPPQAVVVLGAGHRFMRGQYISGVIGLRRLQFGLEQARERKLPMLLCGGRKHAPVDAPSEAALLAEELRWRAPLQSVWLEEVSRHTWEKAELGAEVLRRHGVRRVLLVTDRPHMARASLCFRAQGLEVEVETQK